MIITALKNNQINKTLKEIFIGEVYEYDLCSYEDVISLIEKYNVDDMILITKEILDGDISFKAYINEIRRISKDIRIIVAVDELKDDTKSFLFSNEVFEIIEGNILNIDKVVEVIKSDRKIIYKQSNNCNINNNKENESIVIAKEMIAIYGTSGAGKSTFSSILADKISRTLNINTALLDMDIQNPSIDIMANIEGDTNILGHLVENLDKRDEILDITKKYMVKDRNNSKLSYMTNNVTLFECQNKLSTDYYSKIYSSVNQNYDYTVIDLPSSPFLDIVPFTLVQATKIFFVINANYISIRQAVKYLELMTKLWNISKDKISIVVNKVNKNSLDVTQIKSLLPEYDIVCIVNYIGEFESYINGAITGKKIDMDIQKILKWLNIRNTSERKVFNIYNFMRKVGQKVDN